MAQDSSNIRSKIAALEQQGQKYLQEQKPQLAIPVLQQIVSLDPNNLNAQGNLGVLLYFQGNYAIAIPHMRTALQLQGDLWRIQALLGMAEKRTGEPKQAQKDLERAFSNLNDKKIQIEAVLELIELDTASVQLDEALAVAIKLQKLTPQNPRVLLVMYELSRQTMDQSLLSMMIGGWRLSGTIVAQTGNPFTPYMAVNNSYSLASNNQWYPNVVGNPNFTNPTIDSWFNVSALAAPAPGTFGNMGRNVLYGPGLTQVNLSLQKSFSVTERIKLDFSANATNALNHPSFGQPDLLIGPGHVGKITITTVGGRQMELIGKIRF